MEDALIILSGLLCQGLIIFLCIFIFRKVFRKKKNKNSKKEISLEFKENPKAEPYCIVFDVETTGLIIDKYIRPTKKNITENNNNFPYIVELSWVVLSREKELISEGSYLIKPPIQIPSEATSIHGITDEKTATEGHNIKEILNKFSEDCSRCKALVAHNVQFDKNVVEAEFIRNGLKKPFTNLTRYDTVQMGMKYMRSNKYPNLKELCVFIYGENILPHLNSHASKYDVFFTSHCFFEMKKNLKLYNK